MTKQWLQERVRGFSALSTEELDAIADFTLLWSLFEDRVLSRANVPTRTGMADRISAVIQEWGSAGSLNADAYAEELIYFRERYFANGGFTQHLAGLNLRDNEKPAVVRSVLSGADNDERSCIATIFIVILRYRNNLFHGIKWQNELAGQLGNFRIANRALMRALEEHGRLDGD